VNMIMNPHFHKRRGISWLSKWLSASQQKLCSMKQAISKLQNRLPKNVLVSDVSIWEVSLNTTENNTSFYYLALYVRF
jgi:PIN domain nuclease of toxin-antitoxin system